MPQKWLVLAAVACGTFMATLDSSIVNIALPTLTKSLGSELHQIKWVVITYLLVITCLLLPFGRLADLWGRKRVFTTGFWVFTVGSALCAFSGSLASLLLSRAIQGVGAAMIMANGPAIITLVFPSGERGKALGTLAMVVSTGLISGPSLGGLLITHFGWQAIFLVNIPIGMLGAFLVKRHVVREPAPKRGENFDWAGAALQMLLLLSFIVTMEPPMVAFASAAQSTPLQIPRPVLAAFTLLLGALFIKFESQTKNPLIDFSLLKIQTFWTANLASFLVFVAVTSVTVLMPFFLDEVLELSPDKIGLIMTAIPVTILFIAPISGRLSDRFGGQGLTLVGSLIGGVGLFLMAGVFGSGVDEQASTKAIVAFLTTVGLSLGLFQSPNNSTIMSAVPSDKLGIASALLATIRNLGLVTGTTLATLIFAWRKQTTGDFVTALHFTFFIGGLVAFGALFCSLGHTKTGSDVGKRKA